MIETDVIVVGAGPVGIFCSYYLGLLGLSCKVIDKSDVLGGQCTMLYPEKYIYDIPAFKAILAKDLIHNLYHQAERFRSKEDFILSFEIQSVAKEGDDFVVFDKNRNTGIKAKKIILATGTGVITPRQIEMNLNDNIKNKIFYSVQDKTIVKNKRIAIFGGGDSALDWALEFSNISQKVFLIHKRDGFRGVDSTLESIKNKENIEIMTSCALKNIVSNNETLDLELENTITNNCFTINADMCFVFWGLIYNNKIANDLKLNTKQMKIVVDSKTMMSSQDGIYAVGDCCSYENKLPLIMTGFAEVAAASHDVYAHIKKTKLTSFHSTSLI